MKSLTKLDRYLLFKYLKTFVLAMILIIIIVITFDVSEKLDDFIGNHAPLSEIAFKYYLNFIPGFVNLYSPLFIFISVIFFTSKLAGNTEIIAILGSGISYRRMLRPYVYGSLMVALLVFAFSNFLIPVNNKTLVQFENTYIYTLSPKYFSNVHFQDKEGVQVYAESYDAEYLRVNNFHREQYDADGVMRERITCDKIVYDTARRQWECTGLSRHVIEPNKERLTYAEHSWQGLGVTPDDFNKVAVPIETMNSVQLYRHIKREVMRGSDSVAEAKIELYQRLLNPLAIIIMTFIGVGVSSRKSRGGIGIHLAIGISLAFGFIVFMKVSTVFAIFGTLNPFLSVLLPQAVFGVIALYVIRTAPK